MRYHIFKLTFQTSVHFGRESLHQSESTVCADTLFSALCHEAVRQNTQVLQTLVDAVQADRIRISDAMPFIGDKLYVPKPMMTILVEQQGDSKVKKSVKKLTYIPVQKLQDYVEGKMDVVEEEKYFKQHFGRKRLETKSVIMQDGTVPYNVGVFSYCKGSGLYVIAGYENEAEWVMLQQLFKGLRASGIGGRRSSGLGQFSVQIEEVPAVLQERLNSAGQSEGKKMTLSIGLPKDEELEAAMCDAQYQVVKRSGFVVSETYAPENRKKKDLYVFAAGSVFAHCFAGELRDVSDGGRHPVYCYAKPVWMEVQ